MWLQLHSFIEDVAEEAAAMAPSREALCSWLASYQSVLSKDLTWTEPGTNDIFPGCPSPHPPAELAQGSSAGGVSSAWAHDAMTLRRLSSNPPGNARREALLPVLTVRTHEVQRR